MAKTNLVIVESPAKAKTITKYLGPGYQVKASMGHVRDLPKSKLGVDVEHGFTLDYQPIKGKEEVIDDLKKAAKKSDQIFLATDPDREGEAISWHLKELLELVLQDPGRNRREYLLKHLNESFIMKSAQDKEDMKMNVISTEKAPGAIGPYSQGFEVNGIVYTSGQIPVNPADGTVPEGIAAQAEQSCKNVGAILEAAGSGYDKVIKTTCFLADMGDFAAFNEVYAKYFTSKPARSCVAVKSLPKGVLCEIEAIAEK